MSNNDLLINVSIKLIKGSRFNVIKIPKIRPDMIPNIDIYKPWKIKILTIVKSDAPIVLRIAISLSFDLTLIIVVQRTLKAATPIIKNTKIPIINFSNWTAWNKVPWVFSQVDDAYILSCVDISKTMSEPITLEFIMSVTFNLMFPVASLNPLIFWADLWVIKAKF